MFEALCEARLRGRHRQAPHRSSTLGPRSCLAEDQVRRVAGIRHRRLGGVDQGPAFLVDPAGRQRGREAALRGKVGSGFSEAVLDDLAGRFKRLARKTPPVDGAIPPRQSARRTGSNPKLVANIEFAEFTREGLVRQGKFLGLREDKPAKIGRRASGGREGKSR